jgi:hypothetical protein
MLKAMLRSNHRNFERTGAQEENPETESGGFRNDHEVFNYTTWI